MHHRDTLQTVINGMRPMLQNMPGCYFVKDLDSCYVEISQNIESLTKIKREAVIGRSDYQLPWEKIAHQLRHNDLIAIKEYTSDVFEPLPIDKRSIFITRCIKFPIHDFSGSVIGVVGQTYFFSEKETMREALNAIRTHDQKNALDLSRKSSSYAIKEYHTDFNLTERETECLFLLIRGKSVKEMGKFLDISPRTVEVYIENIKHKMHASSRSEIIDKAEKSGMLEIIPKNTICMSLHKNPHRWKDFLSVDA